MKAILVMDMPKSCNDCNLIYPDKYNDIWCCTACDCVVEENVNDGTLYKGCPLKPMTDAIPISFLKDRIAFNFSWGCYGYAKGLQSAIDEWEQENDKKLK